MAAVEQAKIDSRDENAVNTWDFLRVSIVALVVGLGVAILWELHLAPGHCLQQSISAYFYTPARAVFTGSLISIGVSMLCLRGSTAAENVFLNLSGVFAPLVALIPTPSGGDPGCTSYPATAAGRPQGYTNAMVAVLAVSAVLILVGAWRAFFAHPKHRLIARWQAVGAALLWIVLFVLFNREITFFDQKVHFASAIAMFAFVAVVIALNIFDSRHAFGLYRLIYAVCLATMVVSAAVVLIIHFGFGWENHWVFWFEFLEIVPFTIFWSAQTRDQWHKPERPPARTRIPSPSDTPPAVVT